MTTLLSNYGVSSIRKLQYIQDKIRKTNELLFRWIPLDLLEGLMLYSFLVRKQTRKNDLSGLKNLHLRGHHNCDGWHLDHKLSIFDGFKNNVPIYIVANINNLEMIPAKENLSKSRRSSITLEELIDKIKIST